MDIQTILQNKKLRFLLPVVAMGILFYAGRSGLLMKWQQKGNEAVVNASYTTKVYRVWAEEMCQCKTMDCIEAQSKKFDEIYKDNNSAGRQVVVAVNAAIDQGARCHKELEAKLSKEAASQKKSQTKQKKRKKTL